MQVAVAGVGDVGDEDSWRRRSSSIRPSISGTRRPGTQTSSVSTGPEPLQRPGRRAGGRRRARRPLLVVGATAPNVAPAASKQRQHGAASASPAAPGVVDAGQQEHGGVGLEAHVLPVVDGRQAVPVEQFEGGRDEPGAGHGGDGVAGGDRGRRRSRRRCARRRGRGRSRTVTSVTTPRVPSEPTMSDGEVVAGDALGGTPAEAHELAGAGDDLEAEDVVAGDAVLEAAHARRRWWRRCRRSSTRASWPGPAGTRGRARRDAARRSSLTTPGSTTANRSTGSISRMRSSRRGRDDAAGDGVGPAGESGAGAASDDGDAVGGAEPDGGGDVLGADRAGRPRPGRRTGPTRPRRGCTARGPRLR